MTHGRASDLPEQAHRLGAVHHVAVVVEDLDRALRFYRDVLGLELELVEEIPQTVMSSRCSPHATRSRSLISPTVAYEATASMIAGMRLSSERATSSRRV